MDVKLACATNVYFVNFEGNSMEKWTAVNNHVTTLVSSGINIPVGLALDGSGNVYVAAGSSSQIVKWSAASSNVTTLASVPQLGVEAVALDGAGNVYFPTGTTNEIVELPYAFVDPSPRVEGLAAGNDALPAVLPATENLLPPFAPTSDQSWLTITGITNGVVSFSFTANTGSGRMAHITLLGQTIPITQGVIVTPPLLGGAQILTNGLLQFAFTNNPGATFTVLSTTDLSLPLSDWTVAGAASNIGGSQFQFTVQPATNAGQGFYTVRSP